MNCQSCGKPATVHLTNIVGNTKIETHLCQECAEKQDLLKAKELNLSAILQTVIGQHVGGATDELARLACPSCGIKYMEFKAQGRLGCPRDYDIFREPLIPLLQRIHRAERHAGKVPKRDPLFHQQQQELMTLRQQLRRAIDEEAYEEAARLRDLIHQKEQEDEPR